jgi:hypothetical protein
MLAKRAQNNTVADFTTAAAEIRGFGLRSEIGRMMSGEKWKIFSA